MTTTTLIAGFVLSCAASGILVGIVRRDALRRRILDRPGERSLHVAPMPRGGGLGIALVVLPALAWLAATGAVLPGDAVGLGGGTVLVAGIGWIDDHRSVAAPLRALAQLLAALWVVAWIGAPVSIDAGIGAVPVGAFGAVLAVAAVVWLVNLYNFMDGIDGLAGSQGLLAAAAAAVLFAVAGETGWAVFCAVLAGACAGFLPWNWSPARIFMGDVGAYLLGFTFAALALIGERSGALPILAWIVLLGVFVWDATLTLAMRVRAGESWHTAHKSHAYQRYVLLGHGHARTTLAVIGLNVLLAWPLAGIGCSRRSLLPWALAASALIMLLLWRWVQHEYHERTQ
ncbi:MAG: glycosyltransferase family 4 protein [Gammaproteobacteria bacterium]|nr:glycosyltransferase family 4 protein [Gammaproteobacteria bacterium]